MLYVLDASAARQGVRGAAHYRIFQPREHE